MSMEDYFQTATSNLEWPPSEFWSSTYWDYTTALVGFMKATKQGYWAEPEFGDEITERDVKDMRKTVTRLTKEFPDGRLQGDIAQKWKEARKKNARKD